MSRPATYEEVMASHITTRMDDPLERWPGYYEQSWQQRFEELDKRYNQRLVQLDIALCRVGLARLNEGCAS